MPQPTRNYMVPRTGNRNVPPDNTSSQNDEASRLFDEFCTANTFQGIMSCFHHMCDACGMWPKDHQVFYRTLKTRLTSWKAQSLWTKLDKRAAHKEYKRGTACANTRVFITGAGPCGLRLGIEVALLGGKAVVVEKRDRFTRNNVLHLWPFLIHDLNALGAKKFFGKFCAGSIDHISIRTLQCILLKVALLMGVEVHPGVTFEGFIEPEVNTLGEKRGWRALVTPVGHVISDYEFDVIIGADGTRNTLEGFKRKEFRGKLAIAITVNFINQFTQAEASVEEISGVAFIFNQKFFRDLYTRTGVDLENIVYYKDETHYFVMTAKKHSLLAKHVLKEDFDDPEVLLAKDNVDQSALLDYAREAADFSTKHQLPSLEFAHNHYGQPDVAMFDFTSMFAAVHASRVIEKNGCRLLVGLVGDSLLEPFWPTGSGCARGFLGALDAAWMIRAWASGTMTPLEVMAERESVYQLLSQTTPENVNKNFSTWTVDPNTRYPNLNTQIYKPQQVKLLYSGADDAYLNEIVQISERRSKQYELARDSHNLLRWMQRHLEPYRATVKVIDLTMSWRSGLALCALIHRYRPELVDFYLLNAIDVEKNNQLAFDVAEKHFGIVPIMTGAEMAVMESLDMPVMYAYLVQFYEHFRKEGVRPAKVARLPDVIAESNATGKKSPRSPSSKSPTSRSPGMRPRLSSKGTTNRNLGEKRDEKENVAAKPAGQSQRSDDSTVLRQCDRLEGVTPDDTPRQLAAVKRDNEKRQLLGGLDAGVKGSNKVSALARDLADKWSGKAPPCEEPPSRPKPRPLSSLLQAGVGGGGAEEAEPKTVAGGRPQAPDTCYFCRDRVYLVERYTTQGIVFHRNCFVCEECHQVLSLGAHGHRVGDNGRLKFFCYQNQCRKKYEPAKPQKISQDVLDSRAKPAEAPRPRQNRKIEGVLASRAAAERRMMRERAEYMTESEMEESESEQTAHNLSASLVNMAGDSDEDSSTDSDYEAAFEELVRYKRRLMRKTRKRAAAAAASVKRATRSEEDEGSDSDGDAFSDGEAPLAALARSYDKLQRAYNRRSGRQRQDSASNSDSGTIGGGSDADNETGTTDHDMSDNDDEDDVRQPAIQSKSGARTTSTSHVRQTTTQPARSAMAALNSSREKRESAAEVMQKRMSFFSAAPQPVFIDPKSFLGLTPGSSPAAVASPASPDSSIPPTLPSPQPSLVPVAVLSLPAGTPTSTVMSNVADVPTPSVDNDKDAAVDEMPKTILVLSTKKLPEEAVVDAALASVSVTEGSVTSESKASISEGNVASETVAPGGERLEDAVKRLEYMLKELQDTPIIFAGQSELSPSILGVGVCPDCSHSNGLSPTTSQGDGQASSVGIGDAATPSLDTTNDMVARNTQSETSAIGEVDLSALAKVNESPRSPSATSPSSVGASQKAPQRKVIAPLAGEDWGDDGSVENVMKSAVIDTIQRSVEADAADAIRRIDALLASFEHSPAGGGSGRFVSPPQSLNIAAAASAECAPATIAKESDTSVKVPLAKISDTTDGSIGSPTPLVDDRFITKRKQKKAKGASGDTPGSPASSMPTPGHEAVHDDDVFVRDEAAADAKNNGLNGDDHADLHDATSNGDANVSFDSDIQPITFLPPLESTPKAQSGDSSNITVENGGRERAGSEIVSGTPPAVNSSMSNEDSSNYFTPEVPLPVPRLHASAETVNRSSDHLPQSQGATSAPSLASNDSSSSLNDKMSPQPARRGNDILKHASSGGRIDQRLTDAKRKFFSETSQPVRIDPSSVFATSSSASSVDQSTGSSSEERSRGLILISPPRAGLQDLGTIPSGGESSPLTSSTPTASEVFETPMTTVKRSTSDDRSEPADFDKMKAAAREKARLKSDSELGIVGGGGEAEMTRNPSLKRRQLEAATKQAGDSSSKSRSESTSGKQNGARDSGKKWSLLRPLSAGVRRLDSRQGGKGDSSESSGGGSGAGGPASRQTSLEGKENAADNAAGKDKRRSLLTMLMSSKSVDSSKTTSSSSRSSDTGESGDAGGQKGRRSLLSPVMGKSEKPSSKGDKRPSTATGSKSRSSSQSKNSKHAAGSAYKDLVPLLNQNAVPDSGQRKAVLQERIQTAAPSLIGARGLGELERSIDSVDDAVSLCSYSGAQQSQSPADEDVAKMLKKQQREAKKRQRESEQRRVRQAQELQRKLEEVEMRMADVEQRGVEVEMTLRGDRKDASQSEAELLQEWFDIVHEKNVLLRYESELQIHVRELQLEDQRSRLEQMLRDRMSTGGDDIDEESIMQQLVEVVEERSNLVALIEEDRLREAQSEKDLERIAHSKGFTLHPVTFQLQLADLAAPPSI